MSQRKEPEEEEEEEEKDGEDNDIGLISKYSKSMSTFLK